MAAASCLAQEQEAAPNYGETGPKPVPILSGYAAFVPTWDAGDPTLVSIISPVVLVPVSSNVVFESRAAFEGDFQRRNGNAGDFTGAIDKSIDYMQLDFLAGRYLTITAGRFLTPFNIFNERLYPNWIRDTQTDPLIFPIGTGSDDGFMVRGAIAANHQLILNYTAYFSTLVSANRWESERHAGLRIGMFLPRRRVELGVSVQHQLQDAHAGRYGAYFEWQPMRVPFELRSEGVYSHEEGSGMWAEAAYRLSDFHLSTLRRMQLVARTQFFNIGTLPFSNPGLPLLNTRRTEGGINYYLSDGWKALASYGKTFRVDEQANIWTVGMAYRFVLPLGRGQ
jgi:hypothetical protein